MIAGVARVMLALWVGTVAGVAALVAPRVFHFLDDREKAGQLMAWIFPRVDLFGIAAALAGIASTLRFRERIWRALLLTAMGGAAACNMLLLAPRIAAHAEPFELYHRASEASWGLILVGGVILLARTGRNS